MVLYINKNVICDICGFESLLKIQDCYENNPKALYAIEVNKHIYFKPRDHCGMKN